MAQTRASAKTKRSVAAADNSERQRTEFDRGARTKSPRHAKRKHHADDGLDELFKSLSDASRRAILDRLRDGPRTTTEVVEWFPHLSRFAVMKHLDVLRDAGLVTSRRDGRRRLHSLNAVPIRRLYERWVNRFAEHWTETLADVKRRAESK